MPLVAYNRTRRGRAALRRAAEDLSVFMPSPPSGDLINAILQYADLRQDVGGGRVLLSLSRRRMKDPVIVAPLGREAGRLAEVAVLWDEYEDELVKVLDAARGEQLTVVSDVEPAPEEVEEAAFELTPAALAYLAAHPLKQ